MNLPAQATPSRVLGIGPGRIIMVTVGIDIGSITAKATVLKNGRLVGESLIATGYNAGAAGNTVFNDCLSAAGLAGDQVDYVVATGYGRKRVEFAQQAVTEITCHALGAHFLNSGVRTVIDIGGQDSKVIALDGNGKVLNFAMNDKCAAGTGRFLEVMAHALEVDLDRFGEFSLQAEHPAQISSLCTVFAESEVISLISSGASRADIIAGIHESIASRVAAMGGRVGLTPPVMMSGGVAKNIGVVKALEKKTGVSIVVSPKSQMTGALGAALLARRTLGAL
jgi:predicted CoA-substrate-specific enzyme activase